MNQYIFVMIGNSDDRLTQRRWVQFVAATDATLRVNMAAIHGSWRSMPDEPYQNACWCIEVAPEQVEFLRDRLRHLAERFHQDSVAWAVTPRTELLEAIDSRATPHITGV